MRQSAVVVNWFEGGQLGGVTLQQVWDVLGDLVTKEEEDEEERSLRWTIQYPEDAQMEVKLSADGDDEELLTSIVFPRRLASDRFWMHLFQLVSLGHGVLFLNQDTPVVTHEDSIRHVPSGLIAALGPPRHIGDPGALARAGGE